MDDKVFLFILLIPGVLLLTCYLLLKRRKHGKIIFFIMFGFILLINIIYIVYSRSQKETEVNFSSGIIWLATLYFELIIALIFSIIYAFAKKD